MAHGAGDQGLSGCDAAQPAGRRSVEGAAGPPRAGRELARRRTACGCRIARSASRIELAHGVHRMSTWVPCDGARDPRDPAEAQSTSTSTAMKIRLTFFISLAMVLGVLAGWLGHRAADPKAVAAGYAILTDLFL